MVFNRGYLEGGWGVYVGREDFEQKLASSVYQFTPTATMMQHILSSVLLAQMSGVVFHLAEDDDRRLWTDAVSLT